MLDVIRPASTTARSSGNHRLVVGGIGAHMALHIAGGRRAEAVTELAHLWSRCAASSDAEVSHTLTVQLTEPGATQAAQAETPTRVADSDARRLWERTSRAVTLALIKARAGELLMLHAGAVCHPTTGRTLVFVAPSQTGKTTLTAVLGRHFGYLGDELVAVDDNLRVLGYPKPLSMRSRDGAARAETAADDLRLQPAHDHPTLARIAIINRDPQHTGPATAEELDLFDAIMQLAPQMSSLGAMPAGLQQLAAVVGRTGPVLQITYSEAESVLPLAHERLEQEA